MRIPRIKGLTNLNLELNRLSKESKEYKLLKNKAYKHVIGEYILSGCRFAGKTLSLPDLALFLGEPVNRVMRDTFKGDSMMAGLDFGTQTDALKRAQAVLSMALNFSLSDRAQLQNQANILIESQGEGYKPYLSGEVNRALKNLADQPKMFIEIYKALMAGQQTTTHITQVITNNALVSGQSKSETHYVTHEEVIELLSTNKPSNLELGQALQIEYQDEDMPEISAARQQGIDTGRSGNSQAKIRAKQIEIDNHLSRREKDLRIESNDDFEVIEDL